MQESQAKPLAARGVTDQSDRLLSADELLADLQECCGGSLNGSLAIPELLGLVQHARKMGLRVAREFSAFDGEAMVRGFARITPLDEAEGGGCEITIEHFGRVPQHDDRDEANASVLDEIDRATAEITALLDDQQRLRVWTLVAPDADELIQRAASHGGALWTECVELVGISHQQPMHWRLLDGARCKVSGSYRSWRSRLLPVGQTQGAPTGFELLLIPSEPLGGDVPEMQDGAAPTSSIGSMLAPSLRQPIARIVANAETIRARLAGPLRDEYSEYAGYIASSGQHLGGMLDDLADMEAVESPGFSTAREPVDMADVARRAAAILGVRAQTRGITVATPEQTDGNEPHKVMAIADFRRVLQIAINLIGNAIAYSPEGSDVTVTVANDASATASIHITDQGPGITEAQAEKVFDKFERLGRENDGGSGLGLYISRRLARAMEGDLTIAPGKEQGACFRLQLPSMQDLKTGEGVSE